MKRLIYLCIFLSVFVSSGMMPVLRAQSPNSAAYVRITSRVQSESDVQRLRQLADRREQYCLYDMAFDISRLPSVLKKMQRATSYAVSISYWDGRKTRNIDTVCRSRVNFMNFDRTVVVLPLGVLSEHDAQMSVPHRAWTVEFWSADRTELYFNYTVDLTEVTE